MYLGYLLRAGGVIVPHKYIRPQSYAVTPAQMQDLSAERDTTGVLHRDVVDHAPSKIEFETADGLTNTEIAALAGIFRAAFTSLKARTLVLEYYVPDTDSYASGTFYMPDVQYKIKWIDKANNIIIYEPGRFAFIEY
ncbi:MAG: DUF6711 family protein [Candidatus Pelethousia sp.]|nr:DUF6711 family protein [Candidatus Pelethousia sp.]